ncbi:SusC/RagA family TonB-linked outer membrane protein [Pedobacter montanisoli]|uniref:SusC/RagA family TonB-linked outer membrane protein n=1 Tax=Pedobacter montanisoli TaxID=2923277 RepID=A0ABS9ZRI9_9SPHI|nr:SusC/RagA family TonB-linked outer membrane protein [Pedobacter montanisoli]MCJ0741190.1 SusC/RagA family TonB-linked outer membrane protein [Pedobacter montanisoli]
MRLTTVILIASLMQVSAAGFAQRININKRNLRLETALNEIRKQSGYDFYYDGKIIPRNKSLDISLNDASVDVALQTVLKDLALTYKIDGRSVVIKPKEEISMFDYIISPFQRIDVRGRVLDQQKNPLAGATIKVKGTNQSVITDETGQFLLRNVDEKAVLIIAYMGYTTREINVSNNLGDIVMLLADNKLEEVNVTVSTGYQSLPKERATGAFGSVSRATLDHRPVSNLSSALQGMVAGMQAKEKEDGSVDFLIRGNSSLYAEARPLIVVDGFPVSGSDFSDINPNDIESITVLKDAAAASIWGARSANGVIVIVTKKLKGTSKLNVEGSAFTRIAGKPDLDQLLTTANSADHVAYERKAFENKWEFNPITNSFFDVFKPLTLAQELMYANKYGKISTADMNAELDRLSMIDNRQQIRDLLLQRAILNQYNVNIQTGTERSKTYASMMYEKNKTGYIKSGYDRFNLNFNNDFKITRYLNFNLSANLQYKKQETSGATVAELQELSPYEVLLNDDGSYGVNLKGYNRDQLSQMPLNKFTYSDVSYNLLREIRGRSRKNEVLSSRVQAGLNLTILKGLTFDTRFQYERSKTNYEEIYDESTFYVRDLSTMLTDYNYNTKVVVKSYIPKGGILKGKASTRSNGLPYDVSVADLESFLVRNQFNYDKLIAQKHQISAIAGMEISKYTTSSRANPYVYGYDPDKLQATTPPYGYGSAVDPILDFTGGAFYNAIPGGDTIFDWLRNKYVSFYGNASYTYDNKYTLSGSIRSDASNFITDNPQLRWSPLWSVGAKWNVMNEDFMPKKGLFNRLELRLTYGKNGNVEGSTSTKALLSVGTSPSVTTGTIVASIADNGNPSLRWEKTTSTNLGIDFALLDHKLFGTIDLYNKKGKDITGNIALAAATGTTQQKFNNAEITNRGIELTLGTNLTIPNTKIGYSTSFNYAYNHNNVDKLYKPTLLPYQLLGNVFVEGRPVNPIYTYTYIGMKDGVPQVAGPNGSLQSFNDLTFYNTGNGLQFLNYEGTGTPTHTLGWTNNIRVQNFNLTAIFIGKMGGVYRNPTFAYATTVGSSKTQVDRFVSDVLAGDPNLPGFANPGEPQLYRWNRYAPVLNTLIESSSYIELKELTLEYNLPKKIAEQIKVNNVKFFAQTRDVGLIWQANSKGYNPDWLPGTNRPLQTYTFGINLQF